MTTTPARTIALFTSLVLTLGSCAQDPGRPLGPRGGQPLAADTGAGEGGEDLTILDDQALAQRTQELQRKVTDLTAKAFRYALDHSDGDLGSDGQYKRLIGELKQGETELLRLENEQRRRSAGLKHSGATTGG